MTSSEQISEFLEPDSVWEVFGIKTQEDFIEKFITKGKFHKKVPKSIQKDYRIVERLQFYSYYDFALIDEAFGKSTRIFEASVDIKISDLGLESEKFESLTSKIKKLKDFSSNELYDKWLHAKELRNIFAHHKAGRLMGVAILNAFKHNINMINSVFLEHQEILDKEKLLKKIANKSTHLKNGLFILEYQGKRFLIWSIIPYSSSFSNNLEKSFWVFHPVYGTKSIKDTSDFPPPFKFNLKDLRIKENGMMAKIIETNETIKIYETNNNLDRELYERHKIQMAKIDLRTKENYWFILENDLNKSVSDFIYNHHWN
jgi:hypothetical protein